MFIRAAQANVYTAALFVLTVQFLGLPYTPSNFFLFS